jgi:hypothetical protein
LSERRAVKFERSWNFVLVCVGRKNSSAPYCFHPMSSPAASAARPVSHLTLSSQWGGAQRVAADNTLPFSAEEVQQFERDGFIIKRKHFSDAEMEALLDVAVKGEITTF